MAPAGEKAELVAFAEDVFLKLNAGRTEVDEHSVFDARGSKVAKDLGGVLIDERPDGFEFNDELMINDKVGQELTQRAAVLVVNGDGNLLLDREAFFPQAVAQGVFVDFLIMTVTEEGMGFEGRLTNDVG